MDPTAFVALVEQCAPGVAVEPLIAIVRQASSFEPLLITIEERKAIPIQASSREEAIQLTTEATAAGQKVRIGLAQLGDQDMKQARLTVSAAFDACKHVAAVNQLFNARLEAATAGGRDLKSATTAAVASFAVRQARPASEPPKRDTPTPTPADETLDERSAPRERASLDVYRAKRGASMFVYEQ